jgi:predicted metal-dependent hydrolase
MSHKSSRIAAMIAEFEGQPLDAHFLGYLDCFNQQLFYEAHDVLEDLWLPQRKGPEGAFFKGLIQLAGGFVHLQKNRLKPAAALFKLARANVAPYPPIHYGLEVEGVLALIDRWVVQLEAGGFAFNPLVKGVAPELRLVSQQ